MGRIFIDSLRVVPEPTPSRKNLRTDRLTDLLAVLFIFGIALWIRIWVRTIFLGTYGANVFSITIRDDDPLSIGKYLGLNPGETVNSEGYNDYGFYYIDYVNALLPSMFPDYRLY